MEKDDEVKGSGNSYDFGARIQDPRLGRWLSVDNAFKKYPDLSPYNFGLNNPVRYQDFDGNDVDDKVFVSKRRISPWTIGKGIIYHNTYNKSYDLFLSTNKGVGITKRFTSGIDSEHNKLRGSAGDLSGHTLRFEVVSMIGLAGYTGGYLLTNDGREVRLDKVTDSDIKNSNLKFVFTLGLSDQEVDGVDGAVTLGHEATLHLEAKVKALEGVLNGTITDSKQVLEKIREANNASSNKNVHPVMSENKSYADYVDELGGAVSTPEEKKEVQEEYNEDLKENGGSTKPK